MRGFIFILLFLSTSCTKWIDVTESNTLHQLEDIDASIHSEKTITWDVGKQRGATISKGFSFKVDLPQVSKEGRDILFEKYGIDAWIYKVSRIQRGRKEQLGLITYDLANISRITTDITIHIFYHSASVSQRFRRFHCPAFGHRLLIEELHVKSDNAGEFNLYTKQNQLVRGKITRPTFAPVIFSGGLSLQGSYIVEIALFNSKQKRLYTPFKRVSNIIEVKDERTISVPSCLGIKEEENPLPSSKTPSIRDLEIK